VAALKTTCAKTGSKRAATTATPKAVAAPCKKIALKRARATTTATPKAVADCSRSKTASRQRPRAAAAPSATPSAETAQPVLAAPAAKAAVALESTTATAAAAALRRVAPDLAPAMVQAPKNDGIGLADSQANPAAPRGQKPSSRPKLQSGVPPRAATAPHHAAAALSGGLSAQAQAEDHKQAAVTGERADNPRAHNPSEFVDMSPATAEKEWKHTWGSAREEHVLGKGSFGKVTLMMHRSTGQLAACKQMRGGEGANAAKDNLTVEWEIATYFYRHPHPNILGALASIRESNAIIYELCDESLEATWGRQHGVFHESATRHLMGGLLTGLAHMHNHGILHRDIKPANLLIRCRFGEVPVLKVADFGWSCKLVETGLGGNRGRALLEGCETPGAVTEPYRAPEIVLEMRYGFPIDVWSAGVVCRELLTGVRVWLTEPYNREPTLHLIQRIGGPITPSTLPGCDASRIWQPPPSAMAQLPMDHKRVPWRICDTGQDMVAKLLTLNPKDRLAAAVARRHMFPLPAVASRPPRLTSKRPAPTPWRLAQPHDPQKKAGRFVDGDRGRMPHSAAVAPQAAPRQPPDSSGACDPKGPGHLEFGLGPQRGSAASRPIHKVVPHVAAGGTARASPQEEPVGGPTKTKPCACKGHCGTKGNHIHTNARAREGSAKWVNRCKHNATHASDFCSHCSCSMVWCPRVRHKGKFCWHHQYGAVGLELQAMAVFQDTLVDMLPGDVACFLDACSLELHPVLLTLMSQLWEPEATHKFSSLTRNMKKPTGQRLAGVFLQVAQHMQQLTDQEATVRKAWLQTQIDQGAGSQRLLGFLALTQRLGLFKKVAEPHLHQPPVFTFGLTEDCHYVFTGETQQLDQLIAHLPHTWAPPATQNDYWDFWMQVDADLKGLPSWAKMGGTYLWAHVARKIILLADKGVQWSKTQMRRDVWEQCCPDQNSHLRSIPQGWDMRRVAAIAPRISPMYYSMWACLFGTVTKDARAREWLQAQVASGTTAPFNAVARRLIADMHGVTPAPARVVALAMAATAEPMAEPRRPDVDASAAQR